MIAPFIACFWWNMANRSGALAGMVAGFIAWRVAAAIGLGFPHDLFGFCVSAAVLVVVTLASQKLDPPRPLTDIDGNIVELADRL
jgi:Na+/proline symporter